MNTLKQEIQDSFENLIHHQDNQLNAIQMAEIGDFINSVVNTILEYAEREVMSHMEITWTEGHPPKYHGAEKVTVYVVEACRTAVLEGFKRIKNELNV